jgi:hypothetical protein
VTAERRVHHDAAGAADRRSVGSLTIVVLIRALCVLWKYLKYNWLADHGYLPEGTRDYWGVVGIGTIGMVVWVWRARFRA